jgi:perosamine synthetase
MIPLTVPALGAEEIEATQRVLSSGMLVQGSEVLAFEAALAACTARRHAIAVGSGTAALELALRALDVGPGDEVLCPALTWPSPAHAVLAVGAELVLVDVDAHEWNATAESFARARTPRTRAAIVIDQFGNPARHGPIARALSGLSIVVDAACSLGSRYGDEPCGRHGVIACTSFHPRKVLTTGEGGACLTDDPALDARLRALRNHGQSAPGVFVCASGNHRLTELSAAIGKAQLAKLDALVSARQRLAARMRASLPMCTFQRAPEAGVANGQTLGLVVGPPHEGSRMRDRVIARLCDDGVGAGLLSYALATLLPLAQATERARERGELLAVSRDVAARGLALPLFPSMTDAQCEQVVTAVMRALEH